MSELPESGSVSLIEAKGLSVSFEGQSVLHDVDFHIDADEVVTIVGPNGSGKSTLLRLLIGAAQPDGGTVTARPGLSIGYVPQRLGLSPTLPLTVERFLGLPHRKPMKEVIAALTLVGADHIAQRQMVALSGGQLQRVLLARALMKKPDILVLDEPTQGLDQPGIAAFYDLIDGVRQNIGCAVLMVSHDLHVVMRASDRVICLNGHVCCQGAPTHVSEAPEYRALFGTGTGGALALYRHQHDHDHHHDHNHEHDESQKSAGQSG